MLFYVKRSLTLELTVTFLLAGLGLWQIFSYQLPLVINLDLRQIVIGLGGSIFLGAWTLLVQYGYRLAKGAEYSHHLTGSLAKEYACASPVQILLGGVTAACGEEIFFRGFLQQRFGLILASVAFMAAHWGKKDIRVVSFWSVFQGVWLGLFFWYSRNLAVPMIAHGLFDIGGMIYFRGFMARLVPST